MKLSEVKRNEERIPQNPEYTQMREAEVVALRDKLRKLQAEVDEARKLRLTA